MKNFKALLVDQEAATSVEYAILSMLVLLVGFAAVQFLGAETANMMKVNSQEVANAIGS